MQQFTILLLMALGCCLTPVILAQLNNCLSMDTPINRKLSDLYRGQQSFTVSMLKTIQRATPNSNIFFSPYSTYHALLLAYFGARGHTEQELQKSLSLEWAKSKEKVFQGYRIEKKTRFNRSKKMPFDFASADRIFFSEDITLTTCTKSDFVDELSSMDFLGNAEQCRININEWISNITHNEIAELLSPGEVTPETQMVLANAAYFKGKWANQFQPEHTTLDPFYTSKNETYFVSMMHKTATYNLATDERLQAYILQMPYQTSNDEEKASEISMIIILPSFGPNHLEKVLDRLTPESLELALKESTPREIEVSLPKFEFEQRLELTPILQDMGIKSIFSQDADMSGYSSSTSVFFSEAKHVAKIKVDEEGSTASAATVLFSFRSARPTEPTKFECKHPFLYLIYDHISKSVLFTGIYRDPRTSKD